MATVQIKPLTFVAAIFTSETHDGISIDIGDGSSPSVTFEEMVKGLVPGREMKIPYLGEVNFPPPNPVRVAFLGRGKLKIDMEEATVVVEFFIKDGDKTIENVPMGPLIAELKKAFHGFTVTAQKS